VSSQTTKARQLEMHPKYAQTQSIFLHGVAKYIHLVSFFIWVLRTALNADL
jgi:hypothetical protein